MGMDTAQPPKGGQTRCRGLLSAALFLFLLNILSMRYWGKKTLGRMNMDDEPSIRRHLLPLSLIVIVATIFSGWLLYKNIVPFWVPLVPLPALCVLLFFARVLTPLWRLITKAWNILQSALENLRPKSD